MNKGYLKVIQAIENKEKTNESQKLEQKRAKERSERVIKNKSFGEKE